MKKQYVFILICFVFKLNAQLKVGNNPKNIHTNGMFQVETNSSHFLVTKDSAKVGIGTLVPAAKLDIIGNIKITDGTEGVGKILTSDANGLASWQNNSNIISEPWFNFSTNLGATSNTQNIYQMGNVGIGTRTHASNPLTIRGRGATGAASGAQLMIRDTGNGNAIMGLLVEGNRTGWFGMDRTNNSMYWNNDGTGSGNALNNAQMVLNSAGNLGIGTTSPTGALTIYGSSKSGLAANIQGISGGTSSELIFGRGGATRGFGAIVGVDNALFGGGLAFFTKTGNTTDNFPTGAIQTMVMDWNGRVGINTSSPTHPLHVNGTTRLTNITNGSNSIVNTSDLGLYNQLTGAWTRYVTTNSFHRWFTDGGEGTTAVMTMYNNGNLGIGNGNQGSIIPRFLVQDASFISSLPTSNTNLMDAVNFRPHSRYQVAEGVNNNALSLYSTTSAFGIQAHNFSTGAALPLILQPTLGNVGINTTTPTHLLHVAGGGIRVVGITNGADAVGSSDLGLYSQVSGNYLRYVTNNAEHAWFIDGSSANGWSGTTASMYLNTSGNLGINTGLSAPFPLTMGSGAFCSSSGVWTNASDQRLKTNIVNSVYGLNEILKLRPVNYTMKKDGSSHVGLIAQEVKEIVPEVVIGIEGNIEKGETLGISYGNLVPVLINAIKELKLEIEELKKSIKNK